MANLKAPDDSLYLCCACGKTSTTSYGFDDRRRSTASPGWDESCMLNARLFRRDRLAWCDGRVVEVRAEAVAEVEG